MSRQIEVRYAVMVEAMVLGESDDQEEAWEQAHAEMEKIGADMPDNARLEEYQTDEWTYDSARGTLVRVW